MNKHFKYDPEDIESLMLAKSFEELLPEERVFVLKHLESEREYESMRHLLLESMEVLQSDQPEPPIDLKEKMMAQYRSQHETNTFGKIWLNFFAPLWTNLWERPYLSLAMASVVLFLGVFFWMESENASQMAIQNEPEQIERSEKQAAKPIKEQTTVTKQEAPAENEVSENEMASPDGQQDRTAENRTTEIAEQEDPQELSEPVASAAPEQVSDDVFIAEEEPAEVSDLQSSPEKDFEVESIHPATSSNAADALTSAKAGIQSQPGKSVINDELIALLYTAR